MSALLRSAPPSIYITRRIDASVASVFAAWTDPGEIRRWWALDEGNALCATVDPRIGGSFIVMIETDRGDLRISGGVYREVKPSQKLVFTWARRDAPEPESLVTVLLRSNGAESMLTVIHEQFADETACQTHAQGWDGALAKLDALFA